MADTNPKASDPTKMVQAPGVRLSRARSESLDSLPPTALRLLEAARTIVERDGITKLTLRSIAREAGEHTASIGYYFGDKAGLVFFLADSIGRDATVKAWRLLSSLPKGGRGGGRKRIRALMATQRTVSCDLGGQRILLDILAYSMREPELRRLIAKAYEEYRTTNRQMFVEREEDGRDKPLEALSALQEAVVDGLGIQIALDPDDFDPGPAFELWESLVNAVLDNR
jgi:AcrR family transcriptional regulator